MYLFSLILLCIFTFFATASFITPLVKRVATAKGWVDDPSQSKRKVHKKPVPYLGGVAVYIGFLLGIGAFFVFFPQIRDKVTLPSWLLAYLAGGVLILVIGTADDIFDISATKKLIAQIVISLFVYLGGVQLDHIILPFIGMIEFGQLSALITVFFLVSLMNAINIIDGLDGLAGGTVFLVALINALVALHHGNSFLLFISLLLVAATLGFLKHNWFPGSIFLGDGGSLLIGYLISVIAIQNVSTARSFVETLVPLLVFIYPLLDISIAMFRRLWRGKPVMSADRAHIHHRLLELGISHSSSVRIVIGFAALCAAAGLVAMYNMIWLGAIVGAITFLCLMFGLFVLNYFDPKDFRIGMRLRPQFRVHNAYKKLASVRMKYARSEDELWTYLTDSAHELGLAYLEWGESAQVRTWGAANGISMETVTMDKTNGKVEFSFSGSEENEIKAEVDLITRQLVSRFDSNLLRMRSRNMGRLGFLKRPILALRRKHIDTSRPNSQIQ